MNPTDAHSSLAALRQLQELLNAGTITPAEFDTLKRQLIFGNEPPAPPAAPTPPPAADPAPPAANPEPVFVASLSPEPPPAPTPPPAPDWLAAAAPGLPLAEEASLPPPAERRNPLTAVFVVGGILVLLGIVLFLFIDRPQNPDEHLTSASQTAADSVATVPEVGPQAEQIILPPVAAPETIRVAPRQPVVAAPTVGSLRADSAATAAAAAPGVAAPSAAAPAAKVPTVVAPAGKAPAPAAAPAKAAAPPAPAAAPGKAPAAPKTAPADTTKAP